MDTTSYILGRIEHLTHALAILEGQYNDPNNEIEDICIEIFTNLVIVKDSIDRLRQILNQLKEQHEITQDKTLELKKLQDHINYVIDNITENSESINFDLRPFPNNAVESVTSHNTVSPIPASWKNLSSPCGQNVADKNQDELKISIKTKSYPSITPITTSEFDAVPKYMKGRLTAATINKLIESFNETFKKKYEMVKLPKKSVKTKDLENYLEWKREENTEPKGTFFITGKDLTTFGNIKMDKITLNMITILRHLKRIRETRHVNGPLHYVLLM